MMTWRALFHAPARQRRCWDCEDVLVDVYCRYRHRTLADRGIVGEGCEAGRGRGFLSAQSCDRSCGRHDQRYYDDHNLRDCRFGKAVSGVAIRLGYTTGGRMRRVVFREGHDG